MEKEARNIEAAWEKTASWENVRAKAEAIVSNGGVEIYEDSPTQVGAYVMSGVVEGMYPVSDGGPYEVILSKRSWENKGNVGGWVQAFLCDCVWGTYHSGRPGAGYSGRFCSHAMATLLVANARAKSDFMGDRTATLQYNPDNFYEGTKAVWMPCNAPEAKPDFVSDSGSMYWHYPEGVVRGADHWGNHVGDCDWRMFGDRDHVSAWFDSDGLRYGFCPWQAFESNMKVDGEWHEESVDGDSHVVECWKSHGDALAVVHVDYGEGGLRGYMVVSDGELVDSGRCSDEEDAMVLLDCLFGPERDGWLYEALCHVNEYDNGFSAEVVGVDDGYKWTVWPDDMLGFGLKEICTGVEGDLGDAKFIADYVALGDVMGKRTAEWTGEVVEVDNRWSGSYSPASGPSGWNGYDFNNPGEPAEYPEFEGGATIALSKDGVKRYEVYVFDPERFDPDDDGSAWRDMESVAEELAGYFDAVDDEGGSYEDAMKDVLGHDYDWEKVGKMAQVYNCGIIDQAAERILDIKANQFANWQSLYDIKEDDDVLNLFNQFRDMTQDDYDEACRRAWEEITTKASKTASPYIYVGHSPEGYTLEVVDDTTFMHTDKVVVPESDLPRGVGFGDSFDVSEEVLREYGVELDGTEPDPLALSDILRYECDWRGGSRKTALHGNYDQYVDKLLDLTPERVEHAEFVDAYDAQIADGWDPDEVSVGSGEIFEAEVGNWSLVVEKTLGGYYKWSVIYWTDDVDGGSANSESDAMTLAVGSLYRAVSEARSVSASKIAAHSIHFTTQGGSQAAEWDDEGIVPETVGEFTSVNLFGESYDFEDGEAEWLGICDEAGELDPWALIDWVNDMVNSGKLGAKSERTGSAGIWVEDGGCMLKQEKDVTCLVCRNDVPSDGLHLYCWTVMQDAYGYVIADGFAESEESAMSLCDDALNGYLDSIPLGLDEDDIDHIYVMVNGSKTAGFGEWSNSGNGVWNITWGDGCTGEVYEPDATGADWFFAVDGKIVESGIEATLEEAMAACQVEHGLRPGLVSHKTAELYDLEDLFDHSRRLQGETRVDGDGMWTWEVTEDGEWCADSDAAGVGPYDSEAEALDSMLDYGDVRLACRVAANGEWDEMIPGKIWENQFDPYWSGDVYSDGEWYLYDGRTGDEVAGGSEGSVEQAQDACRAEYELRKDASRKTAQEWDIDVHNTLDGWDGWAEVFENADGVWGWEVSKYDDGSKTTGTYVDSNFAFNTPDEAFDDLWGQDRYIEAGRKTARVTSDDNFAVGDIFECWGNMVEVIDVDGNQMLVDLVEGSDPDYPMWADSAEMAKAVELTASRKIAAETESGAFYEIVTEIDSTWSDYDKSVAQGQLYTYGEIYVDEYRQPIDDEYLVEEITLGKSAGKTASMKKATRMFTYAEQKELEDEIEGTELHNADRFKDGGVAYNGAI